MDWLAAYIALRFVGANNVVFLRRWCKICTILQPMGSKVRSLRNGPNLADQLKTWTMYMPVTLLSQRKLALTAINTLFAL